jgi:hypothetical protein
MRQTRFSSTIGFCFFACSLLVSAADKTWTPALTVLERPPRAEEMAAYPVDQSKAGVNPPGFCWTPHDQASTYRLEVFGDSTPAQAAFWIDKLDSTVYPPTAVMTPGQYRWQVVYRNAEGKEYGVSKSRRFDIPPGLPELPMPDVKQLRNKLANIRPRLFLGGNRLANIREEVRKGAVSQWDFFLTAANDALKEGPYPEPKGYPNGEFIVEDWRRIYRPGKVGSAHLARLALAYKITGEGKYLEGARRWMMNLAAWDPTGIVSHDAAQLDGSEGNDEASMPVLERMAFAWDWIGGELTPKERARVLAVMPERGNQVLRLLRKQDFLSHPFSNHEGRVLAFLGLAGLSFLGDLPEAEEWLDYVLRCYLTSFPAWGGDEGGWAQGIGYWAAYVNWLSSFAEALRGATEVDLLRRPFYRHNGFFPLYFHPPYAPMGAFGDAGDSQPSLHEKLLIDYFAEVFQDPTLKWHASSIRPEVSKVTYAREERPWNEWFLEDLVSLWRAGTARVKPQAPRGEPDSRHSTDIGWVSMHTALGDAEKDVWVLFKSSRFGSFSHSHADQNSFQLHAWGEALAIDSGYYPSYGSPHHVLWSRQTRAHNGILVDGRGQPPFDWNASGTIELYERHGPVTLVRGQAATAYNRPQDPDTIELWKKHLAEPLPPMEPRVDSFGRTLAFLASGDQPLLVVYDQIKTAGPASFDWLLHSLREMKVDPASGSILITNGKAHLAVKLFSTAPLDFSQFGGFPVKPEERAAGAPDQWHLTARTKTKTAEAKFLAVLAPYREGQKPPEIELVSGPGNTGFRVGEVQILAWWGSGETGQISLGSLQTEGRLLLRHRQEDQFKTVICP